MRSSTAADIASNESHGATLSLSLLLSFSCSFSLAHTHAHTYSAKNKRTTSGEKRQRANAGRERERATKSRRRARGRGTALRIYTMSPGGAIAHLAFYERSAHFLGPDSGHRHILHNKLADTNGLSHLVLLIWVTRT